MKIKYLSVVLFLAFASSSYAEVRLWASADDNNGDFGGRAGLDIHCDTDANKPVIANSTTRAFISVNEADEIRDMPANYDIPTDEIIYRADGETQIADNFAALLNAPLAVSIADTPVLMWSGSNSDGSLDENNCTNWTTSDGGFAGANGQINLSEFGFNRGTVNCAYDLAVTMCITYTPPAPAPIRGSASPLKSWE